MANPPHPHPAHLTDDATRIKENATAGEEPCGGPLSVLNGRFIIQTLGA